MAWTEGHEKRLADFVTSTTNHTPSDNQIRMIEDFRRDVQGVAEGLIGANANLNRELSVALTHFEDAVMWGVKSIILHGEVPGEAPNV